MNTLNDKDDINIDVFLHEFSYCYEACNTPEEFERRIYRVYSNYEMKILGHFRLNMEYAYINMRNTMLFDHVLHRLLLFAQYLLPKKYYLHAVCHK